MNPDQPSKASSGERGDEFQFLTFEQLGCVLIVTLARAPVNAVHRPMYREIASAFQEPSALGEDVRAIVLTGAGRHFCGGNDLAEFERMDRDYAVGLMRDAREAFHAVNACEVPTLAAVHGVALGTGLVLAASCDFIIAEEDARFGLPELQVGVAGGYRHLSRLVPQGLARKMFFTSDPVSAREMHGFGGVVELFESDELLAAALEIAKRIARHSPSALRDTKAALRHIEALDLREGYELEQEVTISRVDHPDSAEALRAFREGRDPVFGETTTAIRPLVEQS